MRRDEQLTEQTLHLRPGLGQARATKALQIVLAVGVLLDRHLVRDPGERNIGLSAAQFLERGRGDPDLSGHAGGGGQDAVGADEIAALPEGFAGKTHGRVVVAPDKLSVGSDAAIDRRKRIARAQPQRALSGEVVIRPAILTP